jgi:DNA polymerase
MFYEDVPDTLSQLIRTAFVPRPGYKFIVADFSAIEARVIAWLASEQWRMDAFANGEDIYCASASKMFGVPVVKHGINGELRQKGKVAELACGYGGNVGAMKAMGGDALSLSDAELKQIVTDWRDASPNIVKLWWAVDDAVKTAIRRKTTTETHGLQFRCQSGMLFITLPSSRKLCYAHPQIGENRFGGESVTYMGVGTSKKWERIESYGPKFVENIVQAVARDLLMFSMQTLSHCFIVGHIHDEMIIEADRRMSLEAVCRQMERTPAWAEGLLLRADGYECEFYRKD